MKFRKEIEFAAGPERVSQLLLDEGFRRRVATEAGAVSADVMVTDHGGGRVDAQVISTRGADGLPAAARKILGSQLTIDQREEWTSPTRAQLFVGIPGAPGHVRGSVELVGQGERTKQIVDADIKVSIPIIGKQFEKLIGQILGNILKLQGRLADEELRS